MRYYVEAKTADATDRINGLLIGLGHEPEWSSGQEDTQGNSHDVCEVYTLANAKRVRSVEREDSRVVVDYWKRETDGSRLESARFLVIVAPAQRVRRTMKYKRVVASIPTKAPF